MSKSSRRRRNRRQAYLSRLAIEDPKKFRKEWSKRLASWRHEALYRADHHFDEFGRPIPSVFELVNNSLRELYICGDEAVRLEAYETEEDMTDLCCRMVAKIVDPRIYRLSNMKYSYNRGRKQ